MLQLNHEYEQKAKLKTAVATKTKKDLIGGGGGELISKNDQNRKSSVHPDGTQK